MKRVLKSDKIFDSTSLFAVSFVLITLGILMIVGRNKLYFEVINIFLSTILILGVFQFIRYFFLKLKPQEKQVTFTRSLAYLLFCLFLSVFKEIPLSVMPIIFAIYMLLNGIIKLMTYLILFSSRANGRLFQLFLAIVYFIISIPVLFSPIEKVGTMLIFLGSYTILLGINYFIDFLAVIVPSRVKKSIRRRFRITLPAILEALIPYQVLREINYYWNKDVYDMPLVYEEKKIQENPDLEVFIHVAPNGYNRFGHIDVCLDNRIISYGAYDFSTSKLNNMIGEGMLFETDRDKYVEYCTYYSDKTLFCFGLKLSKRQKDNVKEQIEELLSNATYFETAYEKDRKYKVKKDWYDDYPSRLNKITGAKFYKVNSGPFKTFFVFGCNCSKLADNIIGKSGCDILKMTGIITPGTYYEYLNQEFYRKNGLVISKIIYNNHAPRENKNIFTSSSIL